MAIAEDFDAKQIRIAAEKNIAIIKATFSKPHEFSIVEPLRFEHLSISFYDRCRNELASAGFSFLADIEDVSLKQHRPDPRTFLRVMTDQERSTVVAIYHIKPNLLWSVFLFIFGIRNRKIFEFETEFSDNSYILTSILPQSSMLPPCDKVISFHYPSTTTIMELYRIHRQNCADHIKKYRNLKPLCYQSIDDVEKSQNRQIDVKYRYFLSIGYLTLEWLEKHTWNKTFAKKVYEEIQRIAQAERLSCGL
jgi:hypothetical protein